MGRIRHDAIVVTTTGFREGGLPDIEAFRATLPEHFRGLVVGPIPAAFNSYASYAFLPDGSKEGWPPSDECAEFRAQFTDLFDVEYSDGSSPDEIVSLSFGEDHRDQYGTPAAYYANRGQS
jgi:hypothetical protein